MSIAAPLGVSLCHRLGKAWILTSGSMSSAKGAEEFWEEINREIRFRETRDPQLPHRCPARTWPCTTTSAEHQQETERGQPSPSARHMLQLLEAAEAPKCQLSTDPSC